jgi:DNA-binding transcriptional regulator of glucitol operon
VKKSTFITISVIVVCLGVILSIWQILPRPAWRMVTDQYIHMWGKFASIYQITVHAKAREPQLFTREMSQKTISDSITFQADESFEGLHLGGETPLPYPPVQVYCVAVKIGMDQTEFFFVALHTNGVHSD